MVDDFRDKVLTALKGELAGGEPETLEDACRIVARVSLAVIGPVKDIDDLFERATASAEGLFGVFYEVASEGQKWEWIDMCEGAIRKEQESHDAFSN